MFKRTQVCAGIVLAWGGGALWAGNAVAQDQPQQQLERVEVTGSSIKRIDAATALPVQIITREDIQKTGAANVEQLMQTISAVSSSGGQTASSASGATTGGISSISLRGLTSLRTLVLINGRRVAPYGVGFTNDSVSVDVNSIPLSAIERVEVLKDGASAVYGSDAIAGVVNFILRKDFKGLEMSAEYGNSTQGGAALKRISGSWGKGDLSTDRYNFMIVGSYQREGSLFGKDRDFASKGYNVDQNNDTSSGNTFPANISAVDGSFGSKNPSASTGCQPPYSFLHPLYPSDRCRFDPASLVTLVPEAERASIFGSATFALANDAQAFVEASFNRNSQRTIIQPVPLSDQFTIPLNNPLANLAPYNTYTTFPSSTIILKSTSPNYPTSYVQGLTGGATPDLFVRYRAAVNGNRDLTDVSEAPRLTFGVRGVASGWDFDTAFLYSSSKVTEQVNGGYPVYSKILPLLNSGNVNFFGPNSADIDNQIQATNFRGDAFSVTSSLMSLAGKASKEVIDLPAGPLAVAFGAELREEKYNFQPSLELAQGDLSGYGGNIAAVDKSRNVSSLFGEVNIPVIKNLEANAAVRYDKYQGVGSKTTPKVGLRWQPTSQLLVRGSIGRGFRAPSLADLYTPPTTGVSQPGLTDPVRCPVTADDVKDCSTQFTTANGGKTGLKPEKSTNATLGLIFEPTRNVSIGVDAFKITLKDQIQQGVPQAFILSHLDQFGSFVTRGAPTGQLDANGNPLPGPITSIDQTTLNVGEIRLAGYDLDLRWRIPTANAGRFTLSFSGTYFSKFDVGNPDGTFIPSVGNMDSAITGGVITRWKTYQAVNWALGPWDATLAMNWQSHYTDVPGSLYDPADGPVPKHVVGSYQTFDAQIGYAGFKNTRLILGVRNLLDKDPPYTNQAISFQNGYDPQYGDPRGRFIYARLSYTFE